MSLHERFLAQLDASPDAIAIVDGDRSMTYADVAREAAQMATRLAEADVAPGSLVGLQLPRTADVAGAMLGILSRRCAYVPIDPDYPPQRRRLIANEARLSVVVKLHNGVPVPRRISAGTGRPGWVVPPDAAYVIFTSGSTGRPKGVVVGHEHVLALLEACRQIYRFSPADAWTLFHSYSFDFSVWEFWGAMMSGGQAVVVPAAAAVDAARFADLIANARVTVLNQVPSAFSHLVAVLSDQPRAFPALKYVIFGGEAIRISAVRRWRDLGCAPGARLVNMYGLTETTVHVTHCPLTDKELAADSVGSPIGMPLPHLQVTLTDGSSQQVPVGTPGEMLISGSSVSYGYLGRPDLTADRFIPLPGNAGTAYRSGDWAVADGRGRLYYLGRRDRQVKVRGFRIELGEVEAAIGSHPAVAQCAVITSTSRLGEPMLVAHYACWPTMIIESASLREDLSRRLPAYMVPGRLRRHTTLPITHHGKIDFGALGASQVSAAGLQP